MLHLEIGRFLEGKLVRTEGDQDEIYKVLVHHYTEALKGDMALEQRLNIKV
jgi:hypothetical protein